VEFGAKARALALGPGLGRGEGPQEVVRRLLEELDRPAVVDADGLFDLEPFRRSAPTVLTPHEGELGRLLGVRSEWVAAHRLEAVTRAAETYDCVCLLKGADTLVAAPGEGGLVVSLGTPALATAGRGDLLTCIGAEAAVRDEGAEVLCVAPVAEGLELRAEFGLARILVMGPTASSREIAEAREARLELAWWDPELPEGVRVHLKLDTGMGRWGLS